MNHIPRGGARRTAWLAAVAIAVLVPGAAAHPARPAAWVHLDTFEDPAWPDPGLWRVDAAADASWRPSACRARGGVRSLRAFAGLPGTPEPPCDAPVPPGSVGRVTMLLDLRAATRASRLDLFFDLWLGMPAGDDQGLFIHLLRPRGDGGIDRIPIFGGTATAGLWAYPRRLDLLNLDDVTHPDKPIDLRGGVWALEWAAFAPRGVPSGGGIYVDNVSLVWEPDPAVPTPTVRLTPTPTASLTPTDEPTPTRRPSATASRTSPPDSPTPTEGPPPAALLPLVLDRAVIRASEEITATETVTATGTVTATATVTATLGTPELRSGR